MTRSPESRPAAITECPRIDYSSRWAQGVAGAEARLAPALLDGWVLLGEHTELRLLERELPREVRMQSLMPSVQGEWGGCDLLRGMPIQSLEAGAGAPIIRHWDPSFRSPSGYLGLNPTIGLACGWSDDRTALEWRDDEGVVVRSRWWRAGSLDASVDEGPGEVAEGWLIVAQPRGIARLREMLGADLSIAWRVERDLITQRGTVGLSGARPATARID